MSHLLLLLWFTLALPLAAVAQPLLADDQPVLEQAPVRVENLVGESLVYDVSFLWFDRLAEGRLSLAPGSQPLIYQAVLEARTLGVAGWLTGDRVHRYVSIMELGANGKLRALRHESSVIKGKGPTRQERISRYIFDYRRGVVRYERLREGRKPKIVELPLAVADAPSDFLTAFFNFRTGVFGPIRPGARYLIPTFTRKGKQEIVVEVLTDAERRDAPFFSRRGLLCQVLLDEEIFDTNGGAVYLWIDRYGRPAKGLVQNVLGLGDVSGVLRD